jgi:hypothetical protein
MISQAPLHTFLDSQRQIMSLFRSDARAPNQTMQRTAGSLGSSLFMKFNPQTAATRHPASRR